MDANINIKIKAQTKAKKTKGKKKRSSTGDIVKVKSNDNSGSFVLRLQKYGAQQKQDQSFEIPHNEDNAPTKGSSSLVRDQSKGLHKTQMVEEFVSKKRFINNKDFKTISPSNHDKDDTNRYIVKLEGIKKSLMPIKEDDNVQSNESRNKEPLQQLHSDKVVEIKYPTKSEDVNRSLIKENDYPPSKDLVNQESKPGFRSQRVAKSVYRTKSENKDVNEKKIKEDDNVQSKKSGNNDSFEQIHSDKVDENIYLTKSEDVKESLVPIKEDDHPPSKNPVNQESLPQTRPQRVARSVYRTKSEYKNVSLVPIQDDHIESKESGNKDSLQRLHSNKVDENIYLAKSEDVNESLVPIKENDHPSSKDLVNQESKPRLRPQRIVKSVYRTKYGDKNVSLVPMEQDDQSKSKNSGNNDFSQKLDSEKVVENISPTKSEDINVYLMQMEEDDQQGSVIRLHLDQVIKDIDAVRSEGINMLLMPMEEDDRPESKKSENNDSLKQLDSDKLGENISPTKSEDINVYFMQVEEDIAKSEHINVSLVPFDDDPLQLRYSGNYHSPKQLDSEKTVENISPTKSEDINVYFMQIKEDDISKSKKSGKKGSKRRSFSGKVVNEIDATKSEGINVPVMPIEGDRLQSTKLENYDSPKQLHPDQAAKNINPTKAEDINVSLMPIEKADHPPSKKPANQEASARLRPRRIAEGLYRYLTKFEGINVPVMPMEEGDQHKSKKSGNNDSLKQLHSDQVAESIYPSKSEDINVSIMQIEEDQSKSKKSGKKGSKRRSFSGKVVNEIDATKSEGINVLIMPIENDPLRSNKSDSFQQLDLDKVTENISPTKSEDINVSVMQIEEADHPQSKEPNSEYQNASLMPIREGDKSKSKNSGKKESVIRLGSVPAVKEIDTVKSEGISVSLIQMEEDDQQGSVIRLRLDKVIKEIDAARNEDVNVFLPDQDDHPPLKEPVDQESLPRLRPHRGSKYRNYWSLMSNEEDDRPKSKMSGKNGSIRRTSSSQFIKEIHTDEFQDTNAFLNPIEEDDYPPSKKPVNQEFLLRSGSGRGAPDRNPLISEDVYVFFNPFEEDDMPPPDNKNPLKRMHSDKVAKDIVESEYVSKWKYRSYRKQHRRLNVEKVTKLTMKDINAYPLAFKQFGFSHPIMQHHIKFIRDFFGGKKRFNSCLHDFYADYLELKKPVKIAKGFYFIKLGRSFFTKEEEDTHKKFRMLEFYDGFVSLRQHISFLNPGTLVYFYQTVVYIKEIKQMVYAIVPEDQEDLVLIHTNPDELLETIYYKIRQVNQHITSFRKYKSQKKEYRFGDTHASFIRERILTMCKLEPNFTILLNNTLESAMLKLKRNTEIPGLENTNSLTYKKDIPLFKIIKDFLDRKLIACHLRFIDIGQFFFGLRSPKTLALGEMFKENQDMNLESLPKKVRQHFCTISKKCEITEMKYSIDEGRGIVEQTQKTIRLFPDLLIPSQSVWYVCNVHIKLNLATNVAKESYSITLLHPKENEEDIIREKTAKKCMKKFIEKFQKGSRGIMMEYFENIIDQELREYRRKDEFTIFLRALYAEKTNTDPTEKTKKLKQLLQNEKKSHEINGVSLANNTVEEILNEGHNIEIIDERILIEMRNKME